jgi:hypothetical protein
MHTAHDASEDNKLRSQYEAMFGGPKQIERWTAGIPGAELERRWMLEQAKLNNEWEAEFTKWKIASKAPVEEVADRLSRSLNPSPGTAWRRRL